MSHQFLNIREELKGRNKLVPSPKALLKQQKSGAGEINPHLPTSEPNHQLLNIGTNDPLNNLVNAELDFSNFQLQQGKGMEQNGGPQTAADLQNQAYAQDQMNNPNQQNHTPDVMQGPMQNLNGPMGPDPIQQMQDPMNPQNPTNQPMGPMG